MDTVIRMASSLGLEVVAEGVDHERQQQILRSFGCQYLQGYLHGRPADAEASRQLDETSLTRQLGVDLPQA